MKTLGARLLPAALLCLVAWQWGQAGWIFAKAELAQWLIADAWQALLQTTEHVASDSQSNQTVQSVNPHKPWSWADTWPVARLQSSEHKIDTYVLNGDRGQALAFGPGYNASSRLPGEGTSVIGGHRDTHFRFLKDIRKGEELRVQTRSGQWLNYQVSDKQVIDIYQQPLRAQLEQQQLILVTCYPFDSLVSGGSLRLLVYAQLIEDKYQSEEVMANHLSQDQPAPRKKLLPATKKSADFRGRPDQSINSEESLQLVSQYTQSSPAIAF
ncbi:MAG: class GN sortase [Cellvibrionaceae bacterium]|nr:class GN sortase [Cellvibrionaceae bacterium]|tara:strand:+ start:39803 stop:40609 length:807 start_codon:yes stop_codon:yes gene_type:complete